MIDDPLGLVVQAIAVLAAGMYPVGFLFGACSPCCCPPCGRCTHYANTKWEGDECQFTYDNSETHTFTFNWADVDAEIAPMQPGSFTGGAYSRVGLRGEYAMLAVDVEQFPAVPQGIIDELNQSWEESGVYNPDVPVLSVGLGSVILLPPDGFFRDDGNCAAVEESECPCRTCCPDLTLEIRFYIASEAVGDDGTYIAFRWSAAGTLGDCSQTTVTASSSSWAPNYNNLFGFGTFLEFSGGEFGADFAEFYDALQGWLDDHPITDMQMSDIPACECGACCEPDGDGGSICSDNVAEGDCVKSGYLGEGIRGIYLGEDTTCENDGPCPTGSCCDPATGNCTVTPPWGCDEANYTEGGVCDPNPCPQPPEGACCDAEGGCTQTTEANCGGTWTEGVECDPNPCPQLGACCSSGECSQTLEADCAGIWTEGVACDPDPCPPLGACCDGVGNCSQTFEAECNGFGLRWTEGVDCDPNPCVVGWCCRYTNGGLAGSGNFTQAWCDDWDALGAQFDSVWYEEETECPPNPP